MMKNITTKVKRLMMVAKHALALGAKLHAPLKTVVSENYIVVFNDCEVSK